MDVDIRRLLVLREVARQGTVAAAARILRLTPQAVSQQLATLGRELGVELTKPVGRGITLTPAAKTVLEHAELLVAQLERLDLDLDPLRANPRRPRRIVVGSFSTALFAIALPAIARLRETAPETEFGATQVLPPESLQQLADRTVDLVLLADTEADPFTDPRFRRHDVGRDHFSIAVARDHQLAAGAASTATTAAIDLSMLHDADWIFAATDLCQGVGQAACRSAGFMPRRTHNFGDWESTLRAVSLGLGVAMVPQLARNHLLALRGTDDFVVLPLAGCRPYRRVFALTRRESESEPVARLLAAISSTAAGELG